MDILNIKIKNILTEKTLKIRPENIKNGVTILGITGTLEEGIDTSDATATAGDILAGKTAYVDGIKINGNYIPLDTSDADATVSDLAKNKTAYVNGSKITGTLQTINANAAAAYMNPSTVSITDRPQYGVLDCYFTFTADVLHRKDSKENFNFFYSSIVTAIGLTAAKIKKNETILGITGTYEGEPPTGTISITQNGTVDVSQYASADVNVQAQSEYNAKLSLQGMTTFGIAYAMRKIGDLDLTGITSCSSSFSGLGNLTEIGELSNSSSVTNMGSMFYGCSSLTSLGTSTFGSNFSTENVTNGMSNMFQYCSNLQSLDLTNFNTKKVTYMTRMFQGCSNLETITFGSDFSLEKCTNASSLQQMFGACSKLTNTTLNAILGILATYGGSSNKTLQYIGLTSAQATTCTGLSNWSALSSAGWTTGY